MQANESRRPVVLPLLLVIFGGLLLLDNFLLLGDFDVVALLPLVLVVIGAQLLLRGDLFTGGTGRSFGITRGSVENAALEISAGAVDVDLRALQREGRLIAGYFAAESRPRLNVEGNHATLRFLRGDTPWYTFSDWQMALARDLPWQVFISTHLGQVRADLDGLIVQRAVLATGAGDLHVVCPQEAFEPLVLRSALGAIHFVTPPGCTAQIRVRSTRLFGVQVDPARYEQLEPGVYLAQGTDPDAPLIEVEISGTFGDAYLG